LPRGCCANCVVELIYLLRCQKKRDQSWLLWGSHELPSECTSKPAVGRHTRSSGKHFLHSALPDLLLIWLQQNKCGRLG
jgi:hypothetical protein